MQKVDTVQNDEDNVTNANKEEVSSSKDLPRIDGETILLEQREEVKKSLKFVKTLGKGILIFFVITGIISMLSLLSPRIIESFIPIDIELVTIFTTFATFYFGATGAIYYIIFTSRYENRLKEINGDLNVTELLSPNINKNIQDEYFDNLVKLNMTNLRDNYKLVKIHAGRSFNVAIVAGILGFVLTISGIAIGVYNREQETIALLGIASGILTEFIAGIFFYLYNRTVIQQKEYHDTLIEVQNVLLAFKLVGDLKDEEEKSSVLSKMISQLIASRTKVLTDDSD